LFIDIVAIYLEFAESGSFSFLICASVAGTAFACDLVASIVASRRRGTGAETGL